MRSAASRKSEKNELPSVKESVRFPTASEIVPMIVGSACVSRAGDGVPPSRTWTEPESISDRTKSVLSAELSCRDHGDSQLKARPRTGAALRLHPPSSTLASPPHHAKSAWSHNSGELRAPGGKKEARITDTFPRTSRAHPMYVISSSSSSGSLPKSWAR